MSSCTSTAADVLVTSEHFGVLSDISSLANPSSVTATLAPECTENPQLNPQYIHALFAILHCQRLESIDISRTVLILAECVLSAAVYSQFRDRFISPIMNLSEEVQESLAHSLNRSTQPPNSDALNHPPLLMAPLSNDENNSPSVPSDNPAVMVSGLVDRVATSAGIPLADYKALAAERDAVRRKLAAVDVERVQLLDSESNLRKTLDDALDRLRMIEAEKTALEVRVAEKGRALNEAADAIRESKVRSEEMDTLRQKAQSAEELEGMLKCASKRIEEMASIRLANNNLMAEISALRENEAKMSKHTDYLETQLARSNERVKQLTTLSDTLSSDLTQKENRYIDIHDENEELKHKLDAVTQQLEIVMLQSTGSKAASTTTSQSAVPSVNCPKSLVTEEKLCSDGMDSTNDEQIMTLGTDVTVSEATTPDASDEEELMDVFDRKAKRHICDLLFDAIGFRVGWEDVVECIRGVTQAMHDIEKDEELEQRGAVASECIPPVGDDVFSSMAHSSSGNLQRTRLSRQSGFIRTSQQSLRSDGVGYSGDTESDVQSHLSFVPEFTEMDAKFQATNNGGDEFDYAANHRVKEIPVPLTDGSLVVTQEPNRVPDEFESHSGPSGENCPNEASNGYDGGGNFFAHGPPVNMDARDLGRQKTAFSKPLMNSLKDPSVTGGLTLFDGYGHGDRTQSAKFANGKTTSMSLMVRGSGSRGTSRSDTTSMIARQTRSDLRELQQTMENIRVERQSSLSVSTLVRKLEAARVEMDGMRRRILETESESSNLRREMNLILKEMDNVTMEKKLNDENAQNLLKEKERLVSYLEESVRKKDEELLSVRQKYEKCLESHEKAKEEQRHILNSLESAKIVGRAQEAELSRLRSQLDQNEAVVQRLDSAVQRAEGLSSTLTKEQECLMKDAVESVRQDKLLAEEARNEVRQLVRTQASALEDMKARATAAALSRSISSDDRQIPSSSSRRNLKFKNLWKRIVNNFNTTHSNSSMSNAALTSMSIGSGHITEAAATDARSVGTRPCTPVEGKHK